MNNVYLVYCVDTEGPLNESSSANLQRIYNITGKKFLSHTGVNNFLKSNKNFLLKKEINKILQPNLLNYNKNTLDIKKMLDSILSKEFRSNYKDSKHNDIIYNWFIMDHFGFKSNPRKRVLGLNKIWNIYNESYIRNHINKTNDGFHFHYHPIPFSKSAHHSSTNYLSFSPKIFEILSHKIIENFWFPSVFRPGFHSIRPDSHWFLESYIPFDLSNQFYEKKEKGQKDLSKGRFGYWEKAPKQWFPYKPDHDDYQKIGNCRRWITRCLNIGTRHKVINIDHFDQAVDDAKNFGSSILAFTNHDFRDIKADLEYIQSLINLSKIKYKGVNFIWSEARNAFQKTLKLKRQKNSIRISKYNNTITIKSSKKTFGPQPFLALKVNNKYYHDNLDIIDPFYKWNYTFDENNFSLDRIEKIGIATNDSLGNTTVIVTDNKFRKKIIKTL